MAISLGRLERQRQIAGQVGLRIAQLAFAHALAAQAGELVHDQAQDLGRRLGACVGRGRDLACLRERLEIGLRAIGETAVGPQHLVQAVHPFAAEDPDCHVQGEEIGVPAGNPEMADTHLGLHRVGLVHDDDAPGRQRAARRRREAESRAAASRRMRR